MFLYLIKLKVLNLVDPVLMLEPVSGDLLAFLEDNTRILFKFVNAYHSKSLEVLLVRISLSISTLKSETISLIGKASRDVHDLISHCTVWAQEKRENSIDCSIETKAFNPIPHGIFFCVAPTGGGIHPPLWKIHFEVSEPNSCLHSH